MKSELEMKQDMARLQLVRRQREEAERKALEEKKSLFVKSYWFLC